MERTSIVACVVSEYAKFGRRSGHPEPMPSLRDGCDLRHRNVWTISLFSAKLICVEFYPRTSPITIAGDRTARWAKPLHAAKEGPSLGKHAQRSPPNLCLEGYTTFTALLHDKFLRPTGQPRRPPEALRRLDCGGAPQAPSSTHVIAAD